MLTVAATPEMVPLLLRCIEPERVERMQAMSDGRLVQKLQADILRSSITYCGLEPDGTVVNMGGVWPMQGVPGHGWVWQVITPAIRRHKRAYALQTRALMAQALGQYGRLVVCIESDYRAALRHLRRLGWTTDRTMQAEGYRMQYCERTAA